MKDDSPPLEGCPKGGVVSISNRFFTILEFQKIGTKIRNNY
jgi:hypothetical protein